MVVFRPSIGNREMRRMPDTPPLSFAQLSDLPTPSDVTTPIPVTATIGRPALSPVAPAMISSSIDPFEQCEPFAAPRAHTGDDQLRQRGRAFPRIAASQRRKQLAVLEHHAAHSQIS